MIAFLLAALADTPAASVDGLPVGALAKQALPARGCAAYLFSTGATRTLIGMASADPASFRMVLDGATADYARVSQDGAGQFGFGRTMQYRLGDVTATLDMAITTRGDITQGGVVSDATLRIDRTGRDSLVLPVAGLIGCATS